MATTEIILTEHVPGLGSEADVVKVKAGYARNFLIPRGAACEVTPTALKQLNRLKAKRAEREARELNEADEFARKLNKLKITLTLETGETGKAFGAITAQDISEKLKAEGFDIDRHRIALDHPIKATGQHDVTIKLHADVTATLTLNVKSSSGGDEKSAETESEDSAEPQGFKSKAKARHTK